MISAYLEHGDGHTQAGGEMNRASLSFIGLVFAFAFGGVHEARALISTSGCNIDPNSSCTLAELLNPGASFDLDDMTFGDFTLNSNLGNLDTGSLARILHEGSWMLA